MTETFQEYGTEKLDETLVMKLKIIKSSCHIHATSEKFMKLSKSMNFVHDLAILQVGIPREIPRNPAPERFRDFINEVLSSHDFWKNVTS